jgi:thioredoxin reductase (NADPH)
MSDSTENTGKLEQKISADVAIIGAGPVGLFAAFQLGMLGIKTHLIDSLAEIGGQCSALYPEKPIYDIPGFATIDAQDLIRNLHAQAAPFKPQFHLGQQVVALAKNAENSFDIKTSSGLEMNACAVVIAAGCGAFGPNRPPLEQIASFEGKSVHYMVTDKAQFAGKKLVIAGGGDSAVDWAIALAPIAEKIYMVHRRDKFRAMPESVAQMRALVDAGSIELVTPYQLKAIQAENGEMRGIEVATLKGESRLLAADHLLAFFGLSMDLGPIAHWGLNLHVNHIATNPVTAETSVAGIYAIGDIAHYEHKLKLILCGFSEAALAAHHIYGLLNPDKALHFEYSTAKGQPGAA